MLRWSLEHATADEELGTLPSEKIVLITARLFQVLHGVCSQDDIQTGSDARCMLGSGVLAAVLATHNTGSKHNRGAARLTSPS